VSQPCVFIKEQNNIAQRALQKAESMWKTT